MMIAFRNALTGTLMYVPEEREKEYLEAGHVPAKDTEEKSAKEDGRRTAARSRERMRRMEE